MRRPWALLSLLCLAFTPLAAQNWTEVRSTHFSVITDAGGKRGRQVALRFEQMRAAFSLLIAKDKVNLPMPLQIVAFRNSSEFRRLAPIYNGKPVELAGFYAAGQDRSYIALDTSAENSWPIVFHEYAHALLNGSYPPTQPWFDEGFAQYFSTIEVSGETVTLGKPPVGALDVLQGNKWIPIADLFRVQQDSRTYNDGEVRNIFYAESWMVVHYLIDLQKISEAGIYFDLVKNKHVPVEQAIPQAFGVDAAQLQKQVADYQHSPRNVYRSFKLPIALESINTYREETVHSAALETMLADFALHSPGHQDEATRQLEQIVTRQPDNAAAHASLGFAYVEKEDFEEARSQFNRAIVLDSKNPWVLYYSALLRYRQASDAGKLPAYEDAIASQRELHAAIALNPDFADAYHLLGLAEVATGNDDAAIQDLLTAGQMSPRNQLYLANLGYAYLMARKWDAARTVLQQVKVGGDPHAAQLAAGNLAKLEELQNRPAYQEIPSRIPADYTAPQWRPKEKPAKAADAGASAAGAATDTGPVTFFKGTLKSVDCSAAPGATLVITSGAKTLTVKAPDVKHALVIGADALSCDWKDRRVAVNYRRSAANAGTLVSLEVQ